MEYRPLPQRGNHNCFGCSPNNPSGLKLTFFTDGRKVVSWPKVPEHLGGWGNIVHGGITTTMLDEAMGWAALHLLRKITLTKSIQVEFLRPVYLGEQLRLEGIPLEINGGTEAVMRGLLYNSEDQLCARATARFALLSLDAMREKGIVDEKTLEGIAEIFSFRPSDTDQDCAKQKPTQGSKKV